MGLNLLNLQVLQCSSDANRNVQKGFLVPGLVPEIKSSGSIVPESFWP